MIPPPSSPSWIWIAAGDRVDLVQRDTVTPYVPEVLEIDTASPSIDLPGGARSPDWDALIAAGGLVPVRLDGKDPR